MTSKPNSAGDAEPAAVDREPLQAVGLRRVGDEQERAGLASSESRLDHCRLSGESDTADRLRVGGRHGAEVEVLGELPGLLGRRHPGDQLIDPRSDRAW